MAFSVHLELSYRNLRSDPFKFPRELLKSKTCLVLKCHVLYRTSLDVDFLES